MPQRTRGHALAEVAVRLHDEFAPLSSGCVERCVGDTGRCLENLGYDVTPTLVERLARERLAAVLNSAPPSGMVTPTRSSGHEQPYAVTSAVLG